MAASTLHAKDTTTPTPHARCVPAPSSNNQEPDSNRTQAQTASDQGGAINPMPFNSPPGSKDKQRQADAHQQYTSQDSSEVWPVFGLRMKLTDALLAASTFALFLATAWLVGITRDGSRRQLRAYLLVHGCVLQHGNEPRVHLTIKNFGQTPAHDVQTWVGTIVEEYPLQKPLSEPPDDFTQSISIVGPGSFEESIVPVTQQTGAQWNLIRQMQGAVYVWGRVEYRDAFRKKRVLQFRLMMQGGHGVDTGRFVNCKEGNYAD